MSLPMPQRPEAKGFIDPAYWYHSSFIDSRQYSHMSEDWKDEQRAREKMIIRDTRSKNGVFVVQMSEEPVKVAEAIIAWRDYALALEAKIKELQK